MEKSENPLIRVEIQDVSDADSPPESCPHCQSTNFIRSSYTLRDLQDLGAPGVKRIVRYEKIFWKCKKCNTSFVVKNSNFLERYRYTPSVIDYAIHRILNKGDSNRRVLADLKELHNVEISIGTINKWINDVDQSADLPTSFSEEEEFEEFSGAFSIDGTFRSVKKKKSAMPEEENKLLWLRLTHQKDGRLVAYWRQEKTS